MNRRRFIAALAAIPAALLAGLGRPPLEALEYVPLEASGGYLVPEAWSRELIAKLYAVPPELIGQPSYSVTQYVEAAERQLLEVLREGSGSSPSREQAPP